MTTEASKALTDQGGPSLSGALALALEQYTQIDDSPDTHIGDVEAWVALGMNLRWAAQQFPDDDIPFTAEEFPESEVLPPDPEPLPPGWVLVECDGCTVCDGNVYSPEGAGAFRWVSCHEFVVHNGTPVQCESCGARGSWTLDTDGPVWSMDDTEGGA